MTDDRPWIHPSTEIHPPSPPSYAEAVSEEHLPGHEYRWEPCVDGRGRACSTCGFIEGRAGGNQ